MATTRETMTGHMEPMIDIDRQAATRAALLWAMFSVTVTVAGHISFELGVWLAETYLR